MYLIYIIYDSYINIVYHYFTILKNLIHKISLEK